MLNSTKGQLEFIEKKMRDKMNSELFVMREEDENENEKRRTNGQHLWQMTAAGEDDEKKKRKKKESTKRQLAVRLSTVSNTIS